MNATSASPAEAAHPGAAASAATPTRRVVDAPTRAFHWLLALCFAGAYLSADGERWRLVHVTLGYTMIGLIVFRLLWGLAGPRQARLSLWGARLRAASGVLRALLKGHPNLTATQVAFNGLAIVVLASLAVLSTLSGYLLYQELAGEWLEEVHETLGNGMLALALTHIGLVLGGVLLRGPRTLMSMVSGRQPGRGPDLAKRNHAWLGGLMFAAVLAFWGWQWREAPANAPDSGTDAGSFAAGQRHHGDHEHDDDD